MYAYEEKRIHKPLTLYKIYIKTNNPMLQWIPFDAVLINSTSFGWAQIQDHITMYFGFFSPVNYYVFKSHVPC